MYSFLKSVIIHNKYNTKLICSTILQILTVLFSFSLYIIIVLLFHVVAFAVFASERSEVKSFRVSVFRVCLCERLNTHVYKTIGWKDFLSATLNPVYG